MAEWIKEAIFYHIYPLGFCGAPRENSKDLIVENRISRVIEWIPHLKNLGVNAIYFGPVFESSRHGYDTMDYYQIDRRLGSHLDFKEVCNQLHAAGIKIVLDGVFNHVGRDFWAFKDLQAKREQSLYKDWFVNINFDGNSPYNDGFYYEGWEGHFDLVKLNLTHPEVIRHIFGAVKSWIEEFQINGLRLDVAYCMDQEFLGKLVAFCLEQDQEFWLMGEMIHGDYSRIARSDLLHSATNYECYKGIYSSHNDKNYFEINYSLNRLFGQGGIYKDLLLYNFIDNHDVNRITSSLKKKEHLTNVYTLLFTMPGIPSIYYGSEWGILGDKANGGDEVLRPCLNLKELLQEDQNIVEHIRGLARIRKNSEVICNGLYEQVLVKNEQLVFARVYHNKRVFVVLNLAEQEVTLYFKVGQESKLKDLLHDEKYYTPIGGNVGINMPPFSSTVLEENYS